MASWIVHLRVAENLLQEIPGLDEARFAIGNIAPDSGIPDEKWETFTPPPEISHFKVDENALYPLGDLDFFRLHLAGTTLGPDANIIDPELALRFSFLLGYFFHILTDNLWTVRIGRPTKARFAEKFAESWEFIWEVKRDWYGLDFLYLREHPDSKIWRVFLGCDYEDDYLDMLPAEAVRQRIHYIQAYYQRNDDEIQKAFTRPYQYLSKAEMDNFVEETSTRLFQIYRCLFYKKVDPGELTSALYF